MTCKKEPSCVGRYSTAKFCFWNWMNIRPKIHDNSKWKSGRERRRVRYFGIRGFGLSDFGIGRDFLCHTLWSQSPVFLWKQQLLCLRLNFRWLLFLQTLGASSIISSTYLSERTDQVELQEERKTESRLSQVTPPCLKPQPSSEHQKGIFRNN